MYTIKYYVHKFYNVLMINNDNCYYIYIYCYYIYLYKKVSTVNSIIVSTLIVK